MDLPEYRAAAQRLEAVQEQVAAAEQDIAALEKQKKALQGNVKLLKAVEKVKPDLEAIQPEKNADRSCERRYRRTGKGTEGGSNQRCGGGTESARAEGRKSAASAENPLNERKAEGGPGEAAA